MKVGYQLIKLILLKITKSHLVYQKCGYNYGRYRMPTVISDLIYCLKEELQCYKNDAVVNKETAKFAYNVVSLFMKNQTT